MRPDSDPSKAFVKSCDAFEWPLVVGCDHRSGRKGLIPHKKNRLAHLY